MKIDIFKILRSSYFVLLMAFITLFPEPPKFNACEDLYCDSEKIDVGICASPGIADWDGDGFFDLKECRTALDCDDRDPTTYPGAAEQCVDVDNNCDGIFDDEGGDTPWYPDEDRDLFGDMNAVAQMRCYFGRPDGWVDNDYDCDDSDPTINPITGHCVPGRQ